MESQLAAHQDDSFDAAVARHAPALREAARRLTGSLDEADDLVQEAVLRAWTFWDRFEPGSNARAWLHRILVNTFINAYRKQRRERELFRAGWRRSPPRGHYQRHRPARRRARRSRRRGGCGPGFAAFRVPRRRGARGPRRPQLPRSRQRARLSDRHRDVAPAPRPEAAAASCCPSTPRLEGYMPLATAAACRLIPAASRLGYVTTLSVPTSNCPRGSEAWAHCFGRRTPLGARRWTRLTLLAVIPIFGPRLAAKRCGGLCVRSS